MPAWIASGRVRLVAITPDDAADLVAGQRQDRWHPEFPRRDDVDAAASVRTGGRESDWGGWGPRYLVAGQQAVGTIGFHAPPWIEPTGEVELGFGLVPAARGHGLATEAVAALLAEVDRLGVAVRAAVDPGNAASLRVLAASGFTSLRGSDEDGRLVLGRPGRVAREPADLL